MLTLLFAYLGMFMTTSLLNKKKWNILMSQTTVLLSTSAALLMSPTKIYHTTHMSWILATDHINMNLILLSLWLIPISLIASMGHLNNSSNYNMKIFSLLIIIILMSLMMMFSAYKLIMLFMGFEATLAPTLFLIARWGAQPERMEASYYFMMYTLMSSIPLLVALLMLYSNTQHLSILLFKQNKLNIKNPYLLSFSMIAFLVKVPIFGVHLWLPKAHVEAPVAGSMMLAAILLKMGGYGFMRLICMFQYTFLTNMSMYLIPYCCWGGALAAVICMTQTDLKSLMAYSSVSHMSFMMAGISTLAKWSLMGGIFMLVAHGITSSGLFAAANLYYERTHTRTLMMSRGIKSSTTFMPLFWLMFSCSNLGLPPLPKAIAEILLFSSILSFSMINIMSMIFTTILTAIFSLSVFQLLSSGKTFKWNKLKMEFTEREYILLALHLWPLIMLILNPNMLTL